MGQQFSGDRSPGTPVRKRREKARVVLHDVVLADWRAMWSPPRIVAAGFLAILTATAVLGLSPTSDTRDDKVGRSDTLSSIGNTESTPTFPRGKAAQIEDRSAGQRAADLPVRFRDNGDGTISDIETGLMWEKKCRECGGIHDVRRRLRWSGFHQEATVWDWLEDVNAEGGTGFAGYQDWRIPNVKELVSIVDYGRSDPAVDPAFSSRSCESNSRSVAALDCSFTESAKYWTSTTFSDFPAHALVVDFGVGFVEDRIKTMRQRVRAVRGGAADLAPTLGGSPANADGGSRSRPEVSP
jgi:hypothetical protein